MITVTKVIGLPDRVTPGSVSREQRLEHTILHNSAPLDPGRQGTLN